MAFFGEAFGASMEQPVPDFHPKPGVRTHKSGLIGAA
jgi:hypothetical protein